MSIFSRTEEVVDAIALDINRIRYRLSMLEGTNPPPPDNSGIKLITHTSVSDSIIKGTKVNNIAIRNLNSESKSINIIRDFDGNIKDMEITTLSL